MRKEFCIGV